MTSSHLNLLNHLSDNTISDKDVTLIIPAEDVLLTAATLPKLRSHRLKQALPFALEDQLIDEVEQLHFACGPYQTDGTLPVAVVAHSKMESWLTQLNTLKITPSQYIPEFFTLPYHEKIWSITIRHPICLVRTGAYSGFSCDLMNVMYFLTSHLSTSPKPDALHIYITDTLLTSFDLDKLPIPVQIYPLSQDSATHNTASSPKIYPPFINLLQGNYAAKPTLAHIPKIGFFAGIVCAIGIGLIFLKLIGNIFILSLQIHYQKKLMATIYQKNFQTHTTENLYKKHMEMKLKKLSDQLNQNDFFFLLTKMGEAISHQKKSFQLISLDFREHQFNIELLASTFDTLDALIHELTQQGLSVTQQNASTTDDSTSIMHVKATLSIQREHA